MKISVRVLDPLLNGAVVDLLRAHGHEAHRYDAGRSACALQIASGAPRDATADCATLILRRGASAAADLDPEHALRQALANQGVAVWAAPLNTTLLLKVLGQGNTAALPEARYTPDLSSARHAWVVTDAAAATLVTANVEATALLQLPEDPHGVALADLPLGPRLREALRGASEGLRTAQVANERHLATWWTDGLGQRVLCFLPAPGLSRPADRAVRALAELGKMAATLAHEIRNPVASLAGALELLESVDDPIDRDEILGMAHERLKQLSRLLEKTLTLARPIDGPSERVEVQPVIASAVSTLRLDPNFEDVTISVDAPEETVVVRAFQGPLLQALLNLMLNAAQAQDGHGAVNLTLEVDRGRALLRVHDEGPGIPPEKRAEVFQPFYTTRASGTGLGLAEVRRALEACDGDIEILDSTEGACFQLELPLAREER